MALLLCPEGATAAGPQARAHAAAPAVRRKGASLVGPADAARLLGALPPAPFGAASAQLPSLRSVQPVPREAAHSGCTPGLADGQGFSAALRCAKPKPKEQ
ncbi:MAG: hypothetical protein H0W74_09195 [Sphingosinicella sp.]|nr:hypothetical protein [Sphingosinicella sp.]